MLWLYQRTMFGACENPKNQVLKDLSFREIMTLVPLIIWAFWIGIYPKPFFDVLDKPVNAIVERLNPSFFKAPQTATNVAPGASPAGAPGRGALRAPAGGRRPPLPGGATSIVAPGASH
jgi:NADH-quinone oxidoreductase subunit M